MPLYTYRCSECKEDRERFHNEDIGVCCEGAEMAKVFFPPSPYPRAAFKLFRPYNNGKQMITSKADEKRMLASMANGSVGETAANLRVEPVDAQKRKVEIEELRHEVITTMKAKSPQIAKRVENRAIPDLKTL